MQNFEIEEKKNLYFNHVEQWFSTGVSRHTRVPLDSVRCASSYQFYRRLYLFKHLRESPNTDIGGTGYREKKRLRTTDVESALTLCHVFESTSINFFSTPWFCPNPENTKLQNITGFLFKKKGHIASSTIFEAIFFNVVLLNCSSTFVLEL